MAARAKSTAVLAPTLGLFLDRPPIDIPKGGLQRALNVRIKNKRITNEQVGYTPFPNAADQVVLSGPCILLDTFITSGGVSHLIMGSTKDLYRYDPGDQQVYLLTPRYATGTVTVNGGSPNVTGSGTSWTANAKPGDFISFGNNAQNDPFAVWYEIGTVTDNTHIVLTQNYAGSNLAGAQYTIRKTFTGGITDWWSTASFLHATGTLGGSGSTSDRWYATNGVNPVVAWDGVSTQVYFPNLGVDKCRVVRSHKRTLVLGDITVSGARLPTSIKNSDIGKPETMAGGSATQEMVTDEPYRIVELRILGDLLAVYTEGPLVTGQFVGGDLKWVFRTVVDNVGVIAGRAVADFGSYHHFIARDSEYRFDGISARPINDHIFREVLRRQSPSRLDLTHGWFDEENGELMWAIALTTDQNQEGGPEYCYVEHYLEDTGIDDPYFSAFAQRQIPATAFGYYARESTITWDTLTQPWSDLTFRWDDRFLQAAFPYTLFGDDQGRVFILNSGQSFNGAPVNALARFGRMAAVDGKRKGLMQRIWPFAERLAGADYGLDVRLYAADQAAGAATQLSVNVYDLTQPENRGFVSPGKAARFFELEFGTSGVGRLFALDGYDYDLKPAGAR
jgi:hypothetical protein